MKPQRETASFLLRFTHDLWQDRRGEPRITWRGHLRHIQDGEEFHFTDLTKAMVFIKTALLQLTRESCPSADRLYQEKAMQESFKLWEKFAQSYTEMVLENIDRNGEHADEIQEKVGAAVKEAMKPWWLLAPTPLPEPPAQPTNGVDAAQLLQTVKALQAQVQALQAKVNHLEERVDGA